MATPSETTSDFANARPYERLGSRPVSSASRVRLAFMRAIVWSLIGMIYAPLFTGLLELMSGAGLGVSAYPLASGLAAGAGAVLYGARELALLSTGIGAVAGVAVLILLSEGATLTNVVVVASVLAAAVGLTVAFPRRCSRHVPGKLLAGLSSGAFGGVVLAVVEPLHPAPFSTFVILAFLVSVSGVLYVGSVRAWVRISRRLRLESRPCYLIEAAVMAILAGIAAGSVWMVAAPLLGAEGGLPQLAAVTMHHEIQTAVVGGLLGGGLAGFLLEIFRFSWVHDI
ncbi:hypothetical protein G3480_10120 [Thiorhodococcus mannitoliphagus]|uniref:Uncharacterized protein n=1 Tax=Thiorhodococcus mannitoliphagus TaxID=329406 RepID=A0A6P1DUL2_9GAMM|nr:hypothetical protein [Thiorhodococcus mannitoliphagus]NEX20661.1 hypothetical protein [Thiorhodococcus mannitoliphagus]